MRCAMLVLSGCLLASPVLAQSPYVVGAIGADIFRGERVVVEGFSPSGVGGEALSGALRVGVVPHERWGIELEIAKSGEMTRRSGAQRSPAIPAFIFPDGFDAVFDFERRERTLTISTVGSARQRIGDSVHLIYLGGVVFYRINEETRAARMLRGIVFPPLGVAPVFSSESLTVSYGAGPVAGFEAHVALTEHVRFVPGLRLHGLDGTWLLRPSVGLGWVF